MNSDEREQLQRLREMHQRTREVLEQQKAQFGSYVPTHIELQLQDVNRQIGDIEKKLANTLPEHVINIDFWTRAGAHPHTPNAKSIDWTQYFEPKLPEPITWKDTLLPNLQAQLAACEAEQCCDIALRAKAHITAALAFGYTFPTTSTYDVWVEQNPTEWWHSKLQLPADAVSTPLVVKDTTIDASLPEIGVELNIVWDISKDVGDAIHALNLPIGQRVQVTIASPHKHVVSAEHAKTIAIQIRDVVKKARSRSRRRPIHLFASVPVGLAVLIGTQLNACGPIQCYEHRKKQGDYIPACLLEG